MIHTSYTASGVSRVNCSWLNTSLSPQPPLVAYPCSSADPSSYMRAFHSSAVGSVSLLSITSLNPAPCQWHQWVSWASVQPALPESTTGLLHSIPNPPVHSEPSPTLILTAQHSLMFDSLCSNFLPAYLTIKFSSTAQHLQVCTGCTQPLDHIPLCNPWIMPNLLASTHTPISNIHGILPPHELRP